MLTLLCEYERFLWVRILEFVGWRWVGGLRLTCRALHRSIPYALYEQHYVQALVQSFHVDTTTEKYQKLLNQIPTWLPKEPCQQHVPLERDPRSKLYRLMSEKGCVFSIFSTEKGWATVYANQFMVMRRVFLDGKHPTTLFPDGLWLSAVPYSIIEIGTQVGNLSAYYCCSDPASCQCVSQEHCEIVYHFRTCHGWFASNGCGLFVQDYQMYTYYDNQVAKERLQEAIDCFRWK